MYPRSGVKRTLLPRLRPNTASGSGSRLSAFSAAVVCRPSRRFYSRWHKSMKRVAPGGVCMMPRFFVPPAFMMFGCLTVMMRGMRMMFRGLLMVLGCFF